MRIRQFRPLLALLALAALLTPAAGAALPRRPAPDDLATYVVLLRDQADLAPAYAIRDWGARGRFVLDALRATAGRTQPAVLAALHDLRLAGHVASVEPYYVVNAVVVRGDAAAAQALARRPEVAAVLPEPLVVPIAPLPAPAGSAPAAVEWNIQRIGADDVWAAYGVTGTGIVVANIDSGVEHAHPALAARYRGNLGGGLYDHDYNWWDPTGAHPAPQPISGPYPLSSGHGTNTMGVIVGDDGAGNQIGVAPGARWIAAYGFSGIDGLLSATEWTIAPWRVDDFDPDHPTADPAQRPHIVSNSWGAPGALLLFQPLLEAQRAAGIFNAFAAGNNGENGCGTLVAPADNPAGFAVGATDQADGAAFFSSRGPNATQPWLDTYATGPELAAPGYPIRTSAPGGGYTVSGGTSFATPHVAGTAALLWSAEPDLIGRVTETAAILRGTAVPKTTGQSCGGVPGAQVPNNTFGWGRLDALAAVEFAWHAGLLAGAGAPPGAAVLFQRAGHTVRAAADTAGAFAFPLGAGAYTVTVTAYGYAPWTQAGVVVAQDLTTTLDVALAPLPEYTLSGVVAGGGSARLGLRGTLLLAAADPATGAYSVTVAAGAYTLRAAAAGCEPAEQPITVSGDLTVNVALALRPTYYLRDSRSACGPAFDWIDATDGTPHYLAFQSFVAIPDAAHPFPYYGAPRSTYYVSSLGYVSFSQGHPEHSQDLPTMVLPFEGVPNDVVYGFLDILNPAYGGQGVVYHKVVENRYMVIEFHEVEHWVSGSPETFEFVLDTATGIVTTQYLTVSRPAWTTVGLEDAAGSDGLLYSYANSAGLTNSLAVAFYPVVGPPPADQEPGGVYGALSGTVYLTGTTIPLPGAVVTATSFLHTLTTTAGPAGRYLFPGVCADLYTLQAGAAGYLPSAAATARLRWAGDVAVHDLYLAPLAPAPTLTKTVAPAAVLPGAPLTYTLALANAGPGPLWGAALSDTLPAAVAYVTSTPPGLYEGGALTWHLDVPTGARLDVTLVGQLTTTAAPGSTVTNTAYLSFWGSVVSSTAALQVAAPCREAAGPAFSWAPSRPEVGQGVAFTGTASGTLPITYTWMLAAGSWGTGAVVTHTYTLPGTYTVVLTATNCGGAGVAVAREEVVVRPILYAVYLPLVFRGP